MRYHGLEQWHGVMSGSSASGRCCAGLCSRRVVSGVTGRVDGTVSAHGGQRTLLETHAMARYNVHAWDGQLLCGGN